VSKRKLGFFVQIKENDPAVGGIESDADMGEKDSFRSGTFYRLWVLMKSLIRSIPWMMFSFDVAYENLMCWPSPGTLMPK